MSKFTIEVNDDVSIAPLTKMLVANGYQLKRQKGRDALELVETAERRAAIIAAHARRQELQEMRAVL